MTWNHWIKYILSRPFEYPDHTSVNCLEKILRIFFLSIANLQILYILTILWLTKSGETNAWSCYCQRKCPSTNFVLTTFLNYLNYLCRIKWIESVQKIPLTCLDMCRMLSITFTGDVIVCLNGDCHVYSVRLLYVAWCDRHFQGFCKLQSSIIFTWYYSPCSVMLRHLLFEAKKTKLSARMPALTH